MVERRHDGSEQSQPARFAIRSLVFSVNSSLFLLAIELSDNDQWIHQEESCCAGASTSPVLSDGRKRLACRDNGDRPVPAGARECPLRCNSTGTNDRFGSTPVITLGLHPIGIDDVQEDFSAPERCKRLDFYAPELGLITPKKASCFAQHFGSASVRTEAVSSLGAVQLTTAFRRLGETKASTDRRRTCRTHIPS